MKTHPDILAVIEGRSPWCVVTGDALEVLRTLPNACADAVLTDPPYSSGGMMRGDRMQDVHTKYVQPDSVSGHELTGFSGDNRDALGYWFWVALWINELRRVVKPGGIVAIFTDWRQLPATCMGIQSGGLVWRGVVPWHKPNGRPTQGRWANSCEYLVWATNGPRELDGKAFPGFFQANAPHSTDRVHVTQKPTEVIAEMVEVVPVGGLVLDPFCGSGTTGFACHQNNRRFIGCDIEGHWAAIARRRIADAAPLFVPPPKAADPALFQGDPA